MEQFSNCEAENTLLQRKVEDFSDRWGSLQVKFEDATSKASREEQRCQDLMEQLVVLKANNDIFNARSREIEENQQGEISLLKEQEQSIQENLKDVQREADRAGAALLAAEQRVALLEAEASQYREESNEAVLEAQRRRLEAEATRMAHYEQENGGCRCWKKWNCSHLSYLSWKVFQVRFQADVPKMQRSQCVNQYLCCRCIRCSEKKHPLVSWKRLCNRSVRCSTWGSVSLRRAKNWSGCKSFWPQAQYILSSEMFWNSLSFWLLQIGPLERLKKDPHVPMALCKAYMSWKLICIRLRSLYIVKIDVWGTGGICRTCCSKAMGGGAGLGTVLFDDKR